MVFGLCFWIWVEVHHVHDEHDEGGGPGGGLRWL